MQTYKTPILCFLLAVITAALVFVLRRDTPVTAPFVHYQAIDSVIVGALLGLGAFALISFAKRGLVWALLAGVPICAVLSLGSLFFWVFGVQRES